MTALVYGRIGNPPAKTPCKECPLRRNGIPGALGGYTVMQYLAVLHGPADLACHLSKGFHARDLDAQRSCTGVAMYRANAGLHPSGNAMKAVEIAGPDPVNVFASPDQFYDHHRKGSK